MTLLLATDLDRTLLHNGMQEYDGALARLHAVLDDDHFVFVYVSGRDIGLVKKAITEFDPPLPQYAITDVGTKIYRYNAGNFSLIPEWIDHIRSTVPGWDLSGMRQAIGSVDKLTLQPEEKQSDFKLSYYYADSENISKIEQHFTQALGGYEGVKVIASIDEANHIGLLDVLPVEATKVKCIEFLRKRLALEVDQVIYCGDSGNDLDALTFGYYGIVVRNAIPQVQEAVLQGHPDKGKVHIAAGDAQGNGYYSSGILEGLHHFRFLE